MGGKPRGAERTEHQSPLQRLLGNLPGMAYRCGNAPEWPMQFVSDGCQELTGYSRTEIVTSPGFRSLVFDSDHIRIGQAIRRALKSKRRFSVEYRIRAADGQEKWVWESGVGVFDDDDDGALLFLEGFITDISRQKRVESLRRYRVLAEVAPIGIFEADACGATTYVNDRWCEITGMSAADALGDGLAATMHPDDRDLALGGWLKAAQSDGLLGFEFRFRRPDGQARWVLIHASSVRDTDGIMGYVGTVTDITNAKEFEVELARRLNETTKELRESEEFYRSIHEHDYDLILVIDENGLIREERGATHQLGPDHDLIGHYAPTLVHPDDLESSEAVLRAVTAEPGKVGRHQARVQDVSGQWRWRESTLINLFHVPAVAGVLSVSIDVSERVALQAQVLERERLSAIGVTAAKFAHEIGNPLNGMYLNMQLLERRLAKVNISSSAASSLAGCIVELDRLRELLDEFRALSRIQSFEFESVDLVALLGDVVDTQQALYKRQGVNIEQTISTELPAIHADSTKVRQVVLNLCKNAAEAMPDGGLLRLQAYTAGDMVEIRVEDSGSGIPPNIKVFEPFVTTKSEGTGLGLAIVQQIVGAHGGTITYESESGRGTSFKLSLPFAPPSHVLAPTTVVP